MKPHGVPASVLLPLVLLTAAVCLLPPGFSHADEGRIRVSRKNPCYWEYRGKPVLLLGGSDEDNLFNNPELLKKNLDILEAVGGNYIRSTLSCRDEGNVWPYVKKGGLYDLDEFNPEFWNRLETSIRESEKRGIIVQIEFWASFDYYRNNWLVNPFNPANNRNYTTENTRLETEWNHHPSSNVQPFFHSPPALNDDRILLGYQEAFVRKVLDVTLRYPNVLYCLDNETRAPKEWALYWGGFIKKEAERRGVPVNLTEMWDQWEITHPDHETTYKHPEYFSYTDVSQNNWREGQVHYDRLIWYRNNLAVQEGGTRPVNNVKVYGRPRPRKPHDPSLSLGRWWQNIFAGCASTRFHRPPSGLGLDETAQTMIRAARTFTSAFDIFSCGPYPELLTEREDDEAYCLAAPGKVYAVYFPRGGRVGLRTCGEEKRYMVRWFDPSNAAFVRTEEARPDARKTGITLETPDNARMWLALVRGE